MPGPLSRWTKLNKGSSLSSSLPCLPPQRSCPAHSVAPALDGAPCSDQVGPHASPLLTRAMKRGDPPGTFGAYTYPSGDQYWGQWQEKKKHGRGVAQYATGHRYEGKWSADKKVCAGQGLRARGRPRRFPRGFCW